MEGTCIRFWALGGEKGSTSDIFAPWQAALMLLKHYVGCSDSKLMEQLNTNVHHQIFCDIVIPIGSPITNYKVVSGIRCELAGKLKIGKVQQVLAEKWDPTCRSWAVSAWTRPVTNKKTVKETERSRSEHFLLKKIKARNRKTETLWIPALPGRFLGYIPPMHSKLDSVSKNRPKKRLEKETNPKEFELAQDNYALFLNILKNLKTLETPMFSRVF